MVEERKVGVLQTEPKQQDLCEDRVVKRPEGVGRVGQWQSETDRERQTETELGKAPFPDSLRPKTLARPNSGHEREQSDTSSPKDGKSLARSGHELQEEAERTEIEKVEKDPEEGHVEESLGRTE